MITKFMKNIKSLLGSAGVSKENQNDKINDTKHNEIKETISDLNAMKNLGSGKELQSAEDALISIKDVDIYKVAALRKIRDRYPVNNGNLQVRDLVKRPSK